MRAESLVVDIKPTRSGFEVFYRIDDSFRNSYKVQFPFRVTIEDELLSLIGLWQAIFVAQLCLAKQITLQFPLSQGMVDDIKPVLKSVYDVRCFREKLPLEKDLPEIVADFYTRETTGTVFYDNRKACLSWSGGKDSTYALHMLRKNKYDVTPINFNINYFTAEAEREAVEHLSKILDVKPIFVEVQFPEFPRIASSYSDVFAKPHTHPIPHGRELFMFSGALIVANKFGMSYLCGGIEKEAWTDRINYNGIFIFTHDAGSEGIVSVLNHFLAKYLSKPVRVFSPIASHSDYNVFKKVFTQMPHVIDYLASCYYDRWCGECIKCTRYDVYQKSLGREYIKFTDGRKPFEDQNLHLQLMIKGWQDKTQLNWASNQFALYEAVRRTKNHDSFLKEYYQVAYPQIKKEIGLLKDWVYGDYAAAFLPYHWSY